MSSFFDTVINAVDMPQMARIQQTFDRPQIPDVSVEVLKQLNRPEVARLIRPGMEIAITAGSRGVANIVTVLKTVVDYVKAAGCHPFLFPAMGSHGGATVDGQLEVLQGLGITEASIGAEIRAGIEVTQLATLPDGTPLCIDRHAVSADGIILVNRIKPHTAFRNQFESGLIKMAVIGMGKQVGAEICHGAGWGNMAESLSKLGKQMLQHANILFGIGLIENAYDETCAIEALLKDEFFEKEPILLQRARSLMPSLPFKVIDVLIVDQMGKNISGDGMDPNITGVQLTPFATGGPEVENMVVLDLTPESHGNAVGVGAATVTTQRLYGKIDFEQTYPNCLTSKVLNVCRIPMVAPTDRAAIAAAIYACPIPDKRNLRVVRMKDTLHVSDIQVSPALLEEVRGRTSVKVLQEPADMAFDLAGNLLQ